MPCKYAAGKEKHMAESILVNYLVIYLIVCFLFMIFWYFRYQRSFFYFSMVTLAIPMIGLYVAMALMLANKRYGMIEQEERIAFEEILDTGSEIMLYTEDHFARRAELGAEAEYITSTSIMITQRALIENVTATKSAFDQTETADTCRAYAAALREYTASGLFDEVSVEMANNLYDIVINKLIEMGNALPEVYEYKIQRSLEQNHYRDAIRAIDSLETIDSENEEILYYRLKCLANYDVDQFGQYIRDLGERVDITDSNYYEMVRFFSPPEKIIGGKSGYTANA